MYIEGEEQIESRQPIMKVAFRLLKEAMRELLCGECKEEEVTDIICQLSPERHGYKREEDYATIDEGIRLLGMGKNREKFCQTMRENGIVNEKFNTKDIGYQKKKILAYKHSHEEDYQSRLAKQKRKRNLEKKFGI